jgi:hypothetical protein
MPKKAACPKHTSPTCPTSSSSERARIANTIVLVTKSKPNFPPKSGKHASASTAATMIAVRAFTSP